MNDKEKDPDPEDLRLLRLAKGRHRNHKDAIAMAWAMMHGNLAVVLELDERYKEKDEWREFAHAAIMELAGFVADISATTGEPLDSIFRAMMARATQDEEEGGTLLNAISWTVSRGLERLKERPALRIT